MVTYGLENLAQWIWTFLIRDKKWGIIIFKWERIFSLVGSDFVCNSFYIESEVVANTSDNNTIKIRKEVNYE